MIELMRDSAVPANLMRAAARGGLALPPGEMIEVLVQLTENPVFAEQARMTLAGFDEASSLAVAADPGAPPAVLDYLSKPENLRLGLIPALLENSSVTESRVVDIAHTASRDVIPLLLASARVQVTANVLHALAGNQHLDQNEAQRVRDLLASMGEEERPIAADEPTPYEVTHAAEIAAAEGKPFSLVTLTGDILGLGFDDGDVSPTSDDAVTTLEVLPALEATAAKAAADPNLQKRVSTIYRIAQLTVGQRVQLAMKGNKEERFILIRDGAKVVSLAVLESPKLTESEVEFFAAMRNVQEGVLRGITMKRKFMKVYGVIKALLNNPRTPLDVALPLLPHMLLNDVKVLSTNKNVNDTIRKMSLKLYNQKKVAAGIR